jgi:hypothetical protein
MNVMDNKAIDLSLRVDLATAAIDYANRCVEYAIDPRANDVFDAMMDAEELLFDLINEAKQAICDLEEFA